MEARLLTRDEIQAAWPRLLPLFQRVPVRDYRPDDLRQRALNGQLIVGVVEQAGELQAAIAFEFARYPQLAVVNIVALAGSGLAALAQAFFEPFCAWCHQMGAQAIEARCHNSMARLLRRYGFGKVVNVVRMKLEL